MCQTGLLNCIGALFEEFVLGHFSPQLYWGTFHFSKSQCHSFATRLSVMDAREDLKIIRWCRTEASGHSWQGVVDERTNEAGVNTAAPGRSAILCF